MAHFLFGMFIGVLLMGLAAILLFEAAMDTMAGF